MAIAWTAVDCRYRNCELGATSRNKYLRRTLPLHSTRAHSYWIHLQELVRQNPPTRVIGRKLGCSEAAVRAKATELGMSFKPTNRPPHNRRL